jgi:hypothetical protein
LARIKGGRERSKYDLLAFLFYRTCGNWSYCCLLEIATEFRAAISRRQQRKSSTIDRTREHLTSERALHLDASKQSINQSPHTLNLPVSINQSPCTLCLHVGNRSICLNSLHLHVFINQSPQAFSSKMHVGIDQSPQMSSSDLHVSMKRKWLLEQLACAVWLPVLCP